MKDAEAQADFDQCLKLSPSMKESLNRRIEYVKYHRKQKKTLMLHGEPLA